MYNLCVRVNIGIWAEWRKWIVGQMANLLSFPLHFYRVGKPQKKEK